MIFKQIYPGKLEALIADKLLFLEETRFCIYLDYPHYNNIGDMLIWFGTREFLKNLPSCRIAFNFNAYNFPNEFPKRLIHKHTIFLQGGGNFGDLYPIHQAFRERVIDTFPDNQIVMFPQTLHFKDEALLERSATILNRHPNLVLMWRDSKSYEVGRTLFHRAHSILLPDMAFCLSFRRTGTVESDRGLYVKRMDKERAEELLEGREHKLAVMDWMQLVPPGNRRERFLQVALLHLQEGIMMSGFPFQKMMMGLSVHDAYHRFRLNQCGRMIHHAVQQFSRYPFIITTRLHGHILASLLRIPNILIDNSYGKNRAFFKQWTAEDPLSRLAGSREELEAAARDLSISW